MCHITFYFWFCQTMTLSHANFLNVKAWNVLTVNISCSWFDTNLSDDDCDTKLGINAGVHISRGIANRKFLIPKLTSLVSRNYTAGAKFGLSKYAQKLRRIARSTGRISILEKCWSVFYYIPCSHKCTSNHRIKIFYRVFRTWK